MAICLICDDLPHIPDGTPLVDHVRLMHPDLYDEPEGASMWWCNTCATNVPAEEIHLATWDSPHGDEAHTVCGSGDVELLDERREVA